MNKYVYLILMMSLNFKAIPCLASSQPIFSLVAKTPTSIVIPANRQTTVQYKVTNNTATTRILTMVPIPNVTQLTNDSSQCGNPFTLAKNQSCNLTLLVNGAQQTSSYLGGPVVCKTKSNSNSPDPFLCSQPEPSMELHIYPTEPVTTTVSKLYVSNWDGGSISLCYINTDGTISHCLVTAVSDTFLNPEALAINGNYLFVANIMGGMSSCLIDSTSGELSNCSSATDTANAAYIHAPDGIAINGSTAYISSSGLDPSLLEGMSVCTVSGASLINCSFDQSSGANFAVPSDIAFYNNYIYITNFDSQNVSYFNSLALNTNGYIAFASNLLNNPEGITFANIGAQEYTYFTNSTNHTVTLCQATISQPTTFSGCAITEGYFHGFGNLAILPSQNKAYIPSGLKTIAICDVDPTDGTLSRCNNSTELGFNNPSGLVIN